MFISRSLALKILSADASNPIKIMIYVRRTARSFCRIGLVLVARFTASTKLYLPEMQKPIPSQVTPLKAKSPVSVACLTELTGISKTSSRKSKNRESKLTLNSSPLQSRN